MKTQWQVTFSRSLGLALKHLYSALVWNQATNLRIVSSRILFASVLPSAVGR